MNTYRILEIEHITEHTFRLRIERPGALIKAGQCFNIGLPDVGINREYSLYSAANAPYLDFLVRSIDDGVVSPKLQQAMPGDRVEIHGPYGNFCLRETTDTIKNYLFVATGTGIAPFHSFVATYPDLTYTILHGIRKENECYDAADYAEDDYRPCVSRPESGGVGQRVTDFLTEYPMPVNTIVYLCGNKSMIIDAFQISTNQGISGNNIITEVFF